MVQCHPLLLLELSLLWCYYFQELWPDFDSWYFVDTGSLLASFNLKPFEKTNQFSQSDLNFILTSGVVTQVIYLLNYRELNYFFLFPLKRDAMRKIRYEESFNLQGRA